MCQLWSIITGTSSLCHSGSPSSEAHPIIPPNKNKLQNPPQNPTRPKRGRGGAGKAGTPLKPKGKSDLLSFVQINLRHTQRAWSTLITNLVGIKNPIVLATEPYF